MRFFIRNICFLFMLVMAFQAQATVVTVQFSGTIDGHLSTYDPSLISVPTGAAFSGSFTFDTNSSAAASQASGVLPTDPDYSFAFYRFTGTPYEFNVVLGAQNYSIQQTTIGVYDTITNKPDKFIASTVDNPFTKDNPGGIFFTLVIDNLSSYYSGTGLPNTVPSSGTYMGFYAGARSDSGGVVYSAYGEIDSLTISSVPVPLSLPLFISGLGLLFGFSKRRSDIN